MANYVLVEWSENIPVGYCSYQMPVGYLFADKRTGAQKMHLSANKNERNIVNHKIYANKMVNI